MSQYLEYTHIGAKDDATSLDNLLKALDMIDECNKLRADHGLEPLKVSETAMAMAMVQANYAANGHYNHNYQYDNVGENLDWGFSDDDPYDDWYTAEKETYDAAVKSGDYPDLAKLSPYDVFLKYPDLYQQVGHYLNIVDPEYIATGMAYSGYGETNYDHAFTQEYFNDWNSYNANDTTFDASVYRAKVEAYVNQIKSAQSTYEDALKQVEAAKTALDKANTDVKQAEQDKTAADTRLDVLTDAKNALAKAQTAYEQAKKESDKAAQQVKDLENAKTDLAARTQALAAAQADLDAKTQAYDAARNEADKAKQAETDAETAVRNAQQALTAAQARLAKAKSDAKDTEAVKTAQAKVKEAQDALDQAKTILAKAQADLKQAQTVEAQAKSDYETAKAALKTAQQAANPKHDDNAGQTSLNAAQQATVEAAAKADKVMASTGADTNGIILAVVAFAGMGAATLDLKRRRMDVTARHGMR